VKERRTGVRRELSIEAAIATVSAAADP